MSFGLGGTATGAESGVLALLQALGDPEATKKALSDLAKTRDEAQDKLDELAKVAAGVAVKIAFIQEREVKLGERAKELAAQSNVLALKKADAEADFNKQDASFANREQDVVRREKQVAAKIATFVEREASITRREAAVSALEAAAVAKQAEAERKLAAMKAITG